MASDEHGGRVGGSEDDADPKMAMAGEPIVGMDKAAYDEATGPGALPAHP